MPEEQTQPVDNSAPALDPQGDASAPPTSGPNYVALDALFPDTDEVPEYLRGKPVKEGVRLTDQWRNEASTANRDNREARREQIELARLQLQLRQQQEPRGAPQRVYVPNDKGEAVEAPLDALVGHRLVPLEERIQRLNEDIYWTASETARERGRALAKVDPNIWEDVSPDLGMFLQANQLDTRDPKNWQAAWEGAKKRAMQIAGQKVTVPTMPPAPVGNATSHPNTQRPGPKLNAEQMRNFDEQMEAAGIAKGSKTYKRTMEEVALDIAAGGYRNVTE